MIVQKDNHDGESDAWKRCAAIRNRFNRRRTFNLISLKSVARFPLDDLLINHDRTRMHVYISGHVRDNHTIRWCKSFHSYSGLFRAATELSARNVTANQAVENERI